MTDANRKTIKITLPSEAVPAFHEAKARAEHVAMIKLSDTQYASRLIQWALGQQGQAKIHILYVCKEHDEEEMVCAFYDLSQAEAEAERLRNDPTSRNQWGYFFYGVYSVPLVPPTT